MHLIIFFDNKCQFSLEYYNYLQAVRRACPVQCCSSAGAAHCGRAAPPAPAVAPRVGAHTRHSQHLRSPPPPPVPRHPRSPRTPSPPRRGAPPPAPATARSRVPPGSTSCASPVTPRSETTSCPLYSHPHYMYRYQHSNLYK